MNAQRVALLERGVLIVGFALMVAAVAAVDWRIGLFFAGLLLALSSIDLPRRRA